MYLKPTHITKILPECKLTTHSSSSQIYNFASGLKQNTLFFFLFYSVTQSLFNLLSDYDFIHYCFGVDPLDLLCSNIYFKFLPK